MTAAHPTNSRVRNLRGRFRLADAHPAGLCCRAFTSREATGWRRAIPITAAIAGADPSCARYAGHLTCQSGFIKSAAVAALGAT